jgi:hypothetical protein
MEKAESRTRVLALAGLFVLTTIGMATWVGVTVRRNTSTDSASTEVTRASEHANPTARSRADERAALSAGPTAPSDKDATGRLHIHCVDAVTGKDLTGLTWVVGSEPNAQRLHATGTTDETGCAVAGQLPATTLVIFSLRKPPHAQAFTAVKLLPGESKDVELRVGAGAIVTGRVVDDLLHPLENIEVVVGDDVNPPFLKGGDPLTCTQVAARTDESGNYVIKNVASRPRGIWVVDDDPRPVTWEDVIVSARLENSSGTARAPISPGETKQLEDIVLPRLRGWRGRVVDAAGRGVPDALISTNMKRFDARRLVRGMPNPNARPPGSEGFVLLPGEALTTVDGTFELSGGETPLLASVITKSGVGQNIQLPWLEPGKRVQDVIITLEPASGIALVLQDAHDHPATLPNVRLNPPGLTVASSRNRSYELLKLTFTTNEGDVRSADVFDDGVGGYIAQVSGRIEDASSFWLTASGWSPRGGLLAPRLSDGGVLRLQLDEQPCIRVHLILHGAPKSNDPNFHQSMRLQACLLTQVELSEHRTPCCGVGSRVFVPLVDCDREILLPVDARRPFHVISSFGSRGSADHGLVSPDDVALTLDIDVSHDVVPDRMSANQPPEHTEPGSPKNVGSLRAWVVDSVSGRPVKKVRLHLDKDKHFTVHDLSSLVTNHLSDDQVPAGTWQVRVEAEGYREHEIPNIEIRDGELMDMGNIALEPLTGARFAVQEADGTPAVRLDASIRILDIVTHVPTCTPVWLEGDDSSATIFAALPPEVLVQVERQTAVQWIRVRREPELTIVRLQPWHEVELRVTGAASLLPGSVLILRVAPEDETSASGDKSTSIDHSWPPCRTTEVTVPAGERRLFRCRLGPGHYVIQGESPLFQVVTRSFEVGSGSGLVRVDVESTE